MAANMMSQLTTTAMCRILLLKKIKLNYQLLYAIDKT
jgi:hypothetical protein